MGGSRKSAVRDVSPVRPRRAEEEGARARGVGTASPEDQRLKARQPGQVRREGEASARSDPVEAAPGARRLGHLRERLRHLREHAEQVRGAWPPRPGHNADPEGCAAVRRANEPAPGPYELGGPEATAATLNAGPGCRLTSDRPRWRWRRCTAAGARRPPPARGRPAPAPTGPPPRRSRPGAARTPRSRRGSRGRAGLRARP